MQSILKFLYLMNSDYNISDELILDVYSEILNIKDKKKSNIFLSTLFTYLILNKKNSKLIIKLLRESFKNDNFIPFQENININKKFPIISLSGSGKKGIKTINISTTSAIVAVSLGANIIKPCSIATSSMTGSYDFFEMIGINTDLNISETKNLLEKTGFGIFPIEKIIPKFDSVYGDVFYAPNILSYGLAALICPLKPDIVLYGLASNDIEISGEILKDYGINNYRIVSSKFNKIYYIDELNVFGSTYILDSCKSKVEVFNFEKILNLPKYSPVDIKQSNNKLENVKIALKILQGKDNSAYTDIISLNAGNILQLSGIASNIEEGYQMAKDKIKTGQCIQYLEDIIISSNGNINKLKKLLEV